MLNTYSTTLTRHGYPSNTLQRHVQQQQQQQQQQQMINNSSDANNEQIREKLQPLNTQRLKTLRQATKSFIVRRTD
mgnify:CR=1 FL=1